MCCVLLHALDPKLDGREPHPFGTEAAAGGDPDQYARIHVPANALVEMVDGRRLGGDDDKKDDTKETIEALDAIKETNQEIHDQKSKIAEMEARLEALNEQIKAKKQEIDDTKKAEDTAEEVAAEHHDKFVAASAKSLEMMSGKSASSGLSLVSVCVFSAFLVQ